MPLLNFFEPNEPNTRTRAIAPKQEKHIHTYARIRKRPLYFRCTHPDCSHYNHKDLLIGKRARCPICGESFILTWRELRLSKPHCPTCTKGSKETKKTPDTIQSKFEELFKDIPLS